jgi:predicted  nucleic acid-binding Zn-ribbon protein
MNINRKLLVVALATAMPWMSASAQSAADLQHEIEMLKGQLKMLSEKIEAMNAKPDSEATAQQITRLEQKMDLAEENTVKSGLKGITVKGSMAAF